MTSILLSGPAVEPVALAEARSWLRVDDDAEDMLIAALIVSARLVVEARTGLSLIAQSWRILLDAWPSGAVLLLPVRPLLSLEAMHLFDADNNAAPIDPHTYGVDSAALASRIYFNRRPPDPGRAVSGIQIDATAGFGNSAGDVPEPLRQAIRMLVARWYENRGDTETDARVLPNEVATLIAPWRIARLA